MQLKAKHSMIACAFAALFFFGHAHATTTLAIDSEVDADFGDVDYSGVATGNIDMGSNGVISYPPGFSGAGLGVAGQYRINTSGPNSNTADYEISCDDTGAQVSDGGGNTFTVEADFVVSAGTRTSFGSGFACNGTAQGPYDGDNRIIYLGMRIVIGSPIPSGGAYSTANAGGNGISVTAVLL